MLRRLRTDTIDLYQVHWPDPNTPIEETAGAMAELHKAGKIRAIGVSNFSPAQMDAFAAVAPLHAVQPPYNLFERAIEADVLPYARSRGLAMLAYGSLCRGLLSGRMRPDTEFPASDLRSKDPKFQQPQFGDIWPPSRRSTNWRKSVSASASFIWRYAGYWIVRRTQSPCGARGGRLNSIRYATCWDGQSTPMPCARSTASWRSMYAHRSGRNLWRRPNRRRRRRRASRQALCAFGRWRVSTAPPHTRPRRRTRVSCPATNAENPRWRGYFVLLWR